MLSLVIQMTRCIPGITASSGDAAAAAADDDDDDDDTLYHQSSVRCHFLSVIKYR